MKNKLMYYATCTKHVAFRSLLLLFAILMFSYNLFAEQVNDKPVTLTQPNGNVIHVFASGDYFYNWLHDKDNYTIVMDLRGYYMYAVLKGEDLVATSYEVGIVSPSIVGLTPGVNYSRDRVNKIRSSKGADRVAPNFMHTVKEARKSSSGDSLKASKESRFSATTMNPIVIFVQFKNGPGITHSASYFTESFNTDPNSLRNYYLWNSYNKLDITSTLVGGSASNTVVPYTDDKETSYYQPYSMANPNGYASDTDKWQRQATLWLNAIKAMTSKVPSTQDLDVNKDGLIDMVYFIVAGPISNWNDLLWPHTSFLGTNDVRVNGKMPSGFFCAFDIGTNGFKSTLSHETGHALGAPDFYVYQGANDPHIVMTEPVHAWDIMSNNTIPQQSMSAFTKWKYMGFMDNNDIPEITASGTYTLSPLGDGPSAYKIRSTEENEFFILEYRKKTASSFESVIPGSGLVIYRVKIDPSISGNSKLPYELYVYRQGGVDNLTTGNIGNAYFSLESGRTSFNATTSPSPFLTDNFPGALDISNVGSAGNTISFYYTRRCILKDNGTFGTAVFSSDPDISYGRSYEANDIKIGSPQATTLNFVAGSNDLFKANTITITKGVHLQPGSNFHAVVRHFDNCELMNLPNVSAQLTATGASQTDVTEVTNTTNDPTVQSLALFPNPSEGVIHYELDKEIQEGSYVEIYNSSGIKIYHEELNGTNAGTIQLNNQAAGIYYLRMASGSDVWSKPFIIK